MSFITSLVFPRKCISCGTYIEHEQFICAACNEKFVRVNPPYCRFCGVSKEHCTCAKHSHAYDGAVAPFYYEGGAKDAIHRLKFGRKENVAVYFANEMRSEIISRYFGIDFDILTCVPSTSESERMRGFNQSKSLAENLKINIFPDMEQDFGLLVKLRPTSIQHMLGAAQRRKNIENAYGLNQGRDVRNKTILIVDDILTTGATLDECTTVLKLNGAKAVYAAVAAMTRH